MVARKVVDGQTYFTCTLGEAQSQRRPFQDVNDLIEQQANSIGQDIAVGFYRVGERDDQTTFQPILLTFDEVRRSVAKAAELLQQSLLLPPGNAVGLLSASSPQFFFVWLACIRLGWPVILIDPQCATQAVHQLCHDTEVALVLVDEKNWPKIDKSGPDLQYLPIPFSEVDVFEYSTSGNGTDRVPPETARVAYFHHTSGTSSGRPKPIPQSHHGAVGALLALDGRYKATFTTTPLYHGGPADTFRAWTSGAMIWFFPSRDAPVTAPNVLKCLDEARKASKDQKSPPVKYFTSVPYILQMMSEDEHGLAVLKQMDLVGVGGAALPKQNGDDLVNAGVNLVSRYGSAECGFLLSSHRNYEIDKEWQYLRKPASSPHLMFEAREEGLYELIVTAGWPHMAKATRVNGSFATSDLFEPHPHIRDAWKYHSRSDAQLTLITGKKFDPAPIEDAIVAATDLVSSALVFGNNRPSPGILLFRSSSANSISDAELVRKITPAISKVNAQSPGHAKLIPDMLVPMPFSEHSLEKTSKGTLMRSKAEKRYEARIEASYQEDVNGSSDLDVPDAELEGHLEDVIKAVLGINATLDVNQQLFSIGVDSVASIQIRHRLRALLPQDSPPLPTNIVEQCGNVRKLAEYIRKVRHGQSIDEDMSAESRHREMLSLVEEYSQFDEPEGVVVNGVHDNIKIGEVVLLTGSTGALGAHVLHQLMRDSAVGKIYCLARAPDARSARSRVSQALQDRRFGDLRDNDKVEVLPSKLGQARLGLDDATYSRLSGEVTLIIHLAWSVNFRMALRSFVEDSISSVRNLINLALSATPSRTCPRFAFCSSVASAANYPQFAVPEQILDDPSYASDLGYSQSKWVAEGVCRNAAKHPRLRGRVSVLRVGQLSGDSETGIWNAKEAWPIMLSCAKLTGSLPNLKNQVIDWLPLDIAAKAMLQGVYAPSQRGTDIAVYHVLNKHQTPTWSDLLKWLKECKDFEIVEPSVFFQQLNESSCNEGHQHPAMHLVGHWENSYATNSEDKSPVRFDMQRSEEEMPIMQTVRPVDQDYFNRLWAWIDANLPSP
ncbi:hypothetical protein BDY17DRAFT_273602 [Neohortaea acidophila]|uniref:Carrier domain-containing protein n=1 Tax=Neohortaea acidophila TaxID=245834 RepID=A0A6A6Q4M6_9PEZI|nr:uncharacterized protein BDY17DRAFT_273602 [Neohortaea acidophila]KAF2486979.1 hypothetical protein BDY17DRAFT_273602 [Neohortaea acidophila]